MGNADLIPDRRRNHFPLNGGPRPTDEHKESGQRGAARARAALEAAQPSTPDQPHIVHELGAASVRRARAGIRAARTALQRSNDLLDSSSNGIAPRT